MKRFMLVCGILALAAKLHAFSARDFVQSSKEATGKYAFSYIAIGYYDHFHGGHHDEGGVEHSKDAVISIPVFASRLFTIDPFIILDGNEIKEQGARFALPSLSRVPGFKNIQIDPYFFKNNDAEQYGWGMTAVWRLR